MRQIFLDTETTGLDAATGDRIVEIGCIEMLNRRLSGRTLHHYLNPERPGNPEAIRVHGLTDEFLADKPRFAAVADEFLDFVRGAELVIHNAAFDIGFLDAELARLGRGRLAEHVSGIVDTLAMARERFPGKAASLDALCRRLEVDNGHRQLHGALLDAGLLAEVFIRMTRGQDALVIEACDDTAGTADGTAPLDAVDLSAFVLPVPRASAAEARAHVALLADIAKASGGKLLWPDESPAPCAPSPAVAAAVV